MKMTVGSFDIQWSESDKFFVASYPENIGQAAYLRSMDNKLERLAVIVKLLSDYVSAAAPMAECVKDKI